jgi:hypothetical protein
VGFYDGEHVWDDHHIRLPHPLYFPSCSSQILIRNNTFQDTDADNYVELAVLERVHEGRVSLDKTKVVLEDLWFRVEVESHNLVRAIKILKGAPCSAPNIQNPVFRT